MLKSSLIVAYGLMLSCALSMAQVQPLSRHDTSEVLKYTENYELYLSKGDKRTASEFINKIAFIYWNHNQYREAINFYLRSLDLNKGLGNENGIAMLNNNLGTLYADIEAYDTALFYFKKTYGARKANNQKIGMTSALINMSVVYNNLGEPEQAIKMLNDAVSYSIELNDLQQLRLCYGSLAEIYERLGDAEKTLHYFELYSEIYDKAQKKEIEKVETELLEEKNKKLEAEAAKAKQELELLKKQRELSATQFELMETDSLLTEEQLRVKTLQQEKEILEKDKEILRLAKENEVIKAKRLEQQQLFQQYAFAAAFAFLAIVAFLIYRDDRRTRRSNKLLVERNERIEKQRAELERANTIKNKLFSIVGHDLRSPFNTLISFFYILNEEELPDDVRSIFAEIKQQLHSTSNLLDNLLYWAKSQIQGFEPSLTEISMYDLAVENIELLKQIATGKNISLVNSVPKDLKAMGDKEMIKLVIRNLSQNAIKFTPSEGVVELSGTSEFGRAVFEIRDSGVGMTNDKVESLFRLKTNKSTLGTNNESGTGLGLVLCNEFVTKNNGEMWVESELNKGTKISFSIDQVK